MEKRILNILEFDLYAPTSVAFLKLFNQIFDFSPKVMVTAFYLADLMLLAINSHLYEPSLMASAYLLIGLVSTEEQIPNENNDKMRFARSLFGQWYTPYDL